MLDSSAVAAIVVSVVSGAGSVGTVLYRTRASRLESFGKYQVGLRTAYREFLLTVDQMELESGKIPTKHLEYLRDRYHRAYFGGSKEVEKALTELWPAAERRAGTFSKKDDNNAQEKLAKAMAKHTRP